MMVATEDRLDTLERLIIEAEERRVEQMLYIAALLAEDEDATEAEDGLRQIEDPLVQMRKQRTAEPAPRGAR